MRKIIFIIWICTGIVATSVAQNPSPSTPAGNNQKSWFQMMQDPYANFYETQQAFYQYREKSKDTRKKCAYKIFKRWEYIHQFRADAKGVLPLPSYEIEQYQQYRAVHLTDDTQSNWTEVGPLFYPANASAGAQPTGMGRINAIAFHPTDPKILFVGAPAGGIWKTIDKGLTWTNNSGNLPTLGVSAILVDPLTKDLMYAGTGDRDASNPGTGIYKSVDGGTIWNPVNNGVDDNTTVNMMIMHPSDPRIILAATSSGIYKTVNSGSNWVRCQTDVNSFKDIKFKPGDPTVVYAIAGGRFYRSVNTGSNWDSLSLPVKGSRAVMGVSPNQPNTVYICQTGDIFKGLLRSTESGLNFKVQSTSPLITGYWCLGGDSDSQSYYNLCMTVDPNNASILYVGSINVWKSSNAGVSWSIAANWNPKNEKPSCPDIPAVHADHHVMEWSPVNGNLFLGNDGGVHYTNNGGTEWTEISSGLGIAQIYKVGQSATVPTLSINGFQDNGTGENRGGSFTTVIGGDGMDCLIDYSDTSYRWGSIYDGQIYRKVPKQKYELAATVKWFGLTDMGDWVTPFMQHVKTPSTIFMGRKNIWRSTNTKVDSAGQILWTQISLFDTLKFFSVLEQSIANPDIMYAARKDKKKNPADTLYRSDNVNDVKPAWVACRLPGGLSPSSIKAHPKEPSVVYATAGSKVYKSTDKGIIWSDISDTLPQISINCIAYDTNTNEGLYIGNAYGIYYRNAGMNNWVEYSRNLPRVDIRDLKFYHDPVDPSKSLIKAATYGRGQWQSPLYSYAQASPAINKVTFDSGTVVYNVVASNGINWSVSSDSPWCTVTGSGAGNGSFTAKYVAQSSHLTRTANITMTPDGSLMPKTVKLLQTFPAGLSDDLSKLFKIYPNPATGRFTIESQDQSNKINRVSISDLSGKPVYTAVFNAEQVVQINLTSKPQGTYIATIETRKGVIIKMLKLAK